MLKRLLRRRPRRGKGEAESEAAGRSPSPQQQRQQQLDGPSPTGAAAVGERDEYEDEVADDMTALAPLKAPLPKLSSPPPAAPAHAPAPTTPAAAGAAPAAATPTPTTDAPPPPDEQHEEEDERNDRYAKIILGVYLTALLLGFGLTLLSDIVRLTLPRLLQLSLGLQAGATAFFCLVGAYVFDI